MLFNSFQFLLFFPIVTVIYFLLPHKLRWFHLLVASCVFYMAFVPIYIVILFATIIIDYIAGIMIENATGQRRKMFLILSIVANVGVLSVFKYFNFFAGNINHLLHLTNAGSSIPLLKILLPIGLSFHTFQAMSYTIEVYRGNQKAERHFGIYALYVMFYPQLVAGPIERPQNLLHQFHARHHFDYDNAVGGLRLMMWGMLKKVVIADRLAKVVDPIFDHPGSNSGIGIALAVIFFTFQIFCDFSGYSDIAIGAARVMGFKLMTNFNMPYHSRSVSEFWKRWHISLSTWFKDYLYISLGGNRVSVPRLYFNLFFVFLVSGFWHGANWTFIAWGALHGFYLVFALAIRNARKKIAEKSGVTNIHWLNNFIDVTTTFVLVAFAWIFFRAASLKTAFFIIKKLGTVPREMAKAISAKSAASLNLPPTYGIINCFAVIIFLEVAHIVQAKYKLEKTFSDKPYYVRWSLYFAGLLCIYFYGVFEKHQFIYFQF